MKSPRGFDATILATTATGSMALTEYAAQSSFDDALSKDETKVTIATCRCFIASAPRQHFRVAVTNDTPGDACVSVYVDGEWVYSGLSYHPSHKTIYFSGRLIDESTIQEMRFVDLDTTYDLSDGVQANDGLGSIVVKIHRVKVTGPWDGKMTSLNPTKTKPVLLAEKSGNLDIDHRVDFSAPKAMKGAVKPQTTEWIDDKDAIEATVVSLLTGLTVEKLQEMGLIRGDREVEKQERSEYGNNEEQSSSTRGWFWNFWSRS